MQFFPAHLTFPRRVRYNIVMVTVGISTATLFQRLYNEEALALFAERGVPCAEVFLTSFCEYKPSFARKLEACKGEVAIHSVHVLNTQFEPQLYSEHPRIREDALRILAQVLRSARILGAKHYTFHGIARLKRTFREEIPRVAERTAELSALCERYGVRLCYENVEWAFYNRAGIFKELRAACPSLGGVLDLKQARITGVPYEEYLDEMAGSLTHVHVSDTDGEGRMCLPGEGTFDFDALCRRLRDVGFEGALLIENYAGDYKEREALFRSLQFLKEKQEKYWGNASSPRKKI